MLDRDDVDEILGRGWALFEEPPRKPLWARLQIAWAAFMDRDDDVALIADQRDSRLVSEITALAEENAQLRAKLGLEPWEPFILAKETEHV